MPLVTQAASDEDMTAIRAQLAALSERLDRLEAENRALTSANKALTNNHQQTAMAVAAINDKAEAVADEVKQQTSKPDWTDRMHLKGDFRYRYESFDIEGQPERNRNRVRARAALIADINPSLEVGLGLTSGDDGPVSSNQTLGAGGSSKGINLDLAYFDWSGLADTHIVAGKFNNFIYKSGKNSLLWDGDWRPEGGGVNWDNGQFFANGLGTWLESDNKKDQSFGLLTQLGVRLPIGENLSLTTGVGYHRFDTKGSQTFYGDSDEFSGNGFDFINNTYLYNYEEVELFADLDFDLFERPALIFADFVQNRAVDENDTGYSLGFKLGKAKTRGQWELGYTYQKLEADAVLGLLTDSDFGGGGTDSKGHIFTGSYAVEKNVNANFTYFINEAGLKSGQPINFKRLQLDLSIKY